MRIDALTELGWKKGVLQVGKLNGMTGNNKNKISIHLNNIEKRIDIKDLENYLKQGWIRGSGKTPSLGKSAFNKGKIIIHQKKYDKIYLA
jgi:hypothetical protein